MSLFERYFPKQIIEDRENRYWCIVYSDETGGIDYFLYLEKDYFSEEEILEIAGAIAKIQ